MTSLHCYGFVDAGTPVPEVSGVGEPPGQLQAVQRNEVAAVVSPLDPNARLRARDARAHAAVVDAAFAIGPIVPARFGTVLADEATLIEDVLEPLAESIRAALDGVRGGAQVSVKASYVEEKILASLVRDDREIARLRERTAGADPVRSHSDQMRLGERVAERLADRRQADAAVLLEALRPLASHVSVEEASGGYGIADADLLVDHDGVDALDARLREVAEQFDDSVQLEVRGPTPPYAFADLERWAS